MRNRSALHFVLIIGIANFFADRIGIGRSRSWDMRSTCSPFQHSRFRDDGRSRLVWWWRSVSAEESANRQWKQCFPTPANLLHPRPHELEEGAGHTLATTNLTRPYWIYLAAGALIAAGFADFALIGFHFHKANTVSANLIPVFYAVAMASSAIASIPLGRIFDRFGPNISLFAFLISAAAAPLVFLGPSHFALIGMIFWGIGMSAQGSLFQAMLTGVIPPAKRSTAFGLFDTGYGIAWFLGSATMGLLYEKSILAVALFSVVLQFAALPILFVANKKR
jgi:predicted MFS family arabinose efflux permease